MPSECNEQFGLDSVSYEDLNSPDSLYPKDSLNNLLPMELRIPENKNSIKIYQVMTLKVNDRSLEANLDQPSYLSSTTTTFPAFENNQHSLGVLDCIDMAQSKCLGVSNEVVSEFPLLSNVGEVPVGLDPFPELSDIGSPSTTACSSAATSPGPSSPLMNDADYLAPSPLNPMEDENSIQSLQDLMSLNEDSLASLCEIDNNLDRPRKSRKNSDDQSPSSPSSSDLSSVFDADGAEASPHNFNFFDEADLDTSSQEVPMELDTPASPVKEPSLNAVYHSKEDGIELKIVVQPETHHRARYQTEGSRGCVKDESQNGFPTVKLVGYDQKYNLQVFVGNDSGKVKPHGFYQASKVSGRNNTPSEEKTIDSTSVIEILIDPSDDLQAIIDCVGIMKLRNADVEHKGLTLPKSKKKKVPTATLR